MNYYVYMIKSVKYGKVKTYVGYTIDLKKRVLKHNLGKGAKSTRGRNWKLIFKKKCPTKSSALKTEYFIKKNSVIRNKIKNGYRLNNILCT